MGDLIGNNDGSTNSPCRLQHHLETTHSLQSKTINYISSVLPLNLCVAWVFKSISHSTEHVTHTDTIVIYRSTYSQNANAMSRGISSRSNLAETCHAMLVSTDAMSKSRHQQLLQSLPVNFCGPMVYPHKLVDYGSL